MDIRDKYDNNGSVGAVAVVNKELNDWVLLCIDD